MAFNPEVAKEVQQRKFDGEWKRCYRTKAKLLMSHPGNPEYLNELKVLEQQARSKHGLIGRKADRDLPDDVQMDVTVTAISRKLVKGWDDVVGSDGQPLPFSPELFREFVKELVEFRMDVFDLITASVEEESSEREAISGNS